MSDPDERRMAELLRAGLPAEEPPEGLWERSHGRYRRVRARRRATGAVAAVVAVLAVGLAIPRLLPTSPQEGVVLDTPPAGPSAAPSLLPETVAPAPAPATCASADLPADAQRRAVGDVDGDGAADTVALAAGALHLVTAGGLVTPPLEVGAEPVSGVGVADVDADGDGDLFVRTPGRAGERVVIARLDGCALSYLYNAQGEPYAFDVGERGGALVGMGCVDVDDDGELELLGLEARLDGDAYAVDRTVVELRGPRAANADIDTVRVAAGDQRGVELLSSATCGERLLDDAAFG